MLIWLSLLLLLLLQTLQRWCRSRVTSEFSFRFVIEINHACIVLAIVARITAFPGARRAVRMNAFHTLVRPDLCMTLSLSFPRVVFDRRPFV